MSKNIRFIGKQWTLEYANGTAYATNQSAHTWLTNNGATIASRSGARPQALPYSIQQKLFAMWRANQRKRKNPRAGGFFKSDITLSLEGKLRTIDIYGYESGKALFDVIVVDGVRYFRKSMGGWTIAPTDVHRKIIKHFNIPGTMSNPRRRKYRRRTRRNCGCRKNPCRHYRRNRKRRSTR